MGRFSGVLIASDFDNTMADTTGALKAGTLPKISEANRQAIEYFMAEGGTFCVATGRSLPSFETVRPSIPSNGPTILFNGAAIFDYTKNEYLYRAFLTKPVRQHIRQILSDWPQVACELYHDDTSIHGLQSNEWMEEHGQVTNSPVTYAPDLSQVPEPLSKALFESDTQTLKDLEAYIAAQPWGGDYEIVLSSFYLLEMTAKGATKGGMVKKLRQLLGAAPEHTYCIGDYANDVSMLLESAVPFAPKNAVEEIYQVPGVHILPPCWEDTVVAMVEELKLRYPQS